MCWAQTSVFGPSYSPSWFVMLHHSLSCFSPCLLNEAIGLPLVLHLGCTSGSGRHLEIPHLNQSLDQLSLISGPEDLEPPIFEKMLPGYSKPKAENLGSELRDHVSFHLKATCSLWLKQMFTNWAVLPHLIFFNHASPSHMWLWKPLFIW
jgi:hypothetical protein